jgi:hypothetical protein
MVHQNAAAPWLHKPAGSDRREPHHGSASFVEGHMTGIQKFAQANA